VARPKSDDKRNAILDAATRVFAERGLTAAPTSEISKQAGVAEGTLFTYFKTKDDLINALYREIKLELADAMMSGFPRRKSVRTRLRHVWEGYVNWGVTNPKQRRVLAQLQVSGTLSKESIEAGSAPFVEMQNMIRDAIGQHIFPSRPPNRVDFEDDGGFSGSGHGPDRAEASLGKQVSQGWLRDLLGRDRPGVILCIHVMSE
jgi:AcrR family transcriptional regulator